MDQVTRALRPDEIANLQAVPKAAPVQAPPASNNSAGTVVTLKRPVEHEGRTYATIVIDEPTVGAIEAMERAQSAGASSTGATIALLAVDTGWPVEALRKIRTSDLAAITEAMAPFSTDAVSGDTGA